MSEQSPEKLNSSEAPAETYSLASILSEYKSEAFIRNERRLSKEELEKRAEEIIREMKLSVEAELEEDTSIWEEPEEDTPDVTEAPIASEADSALLSPETPESVPAAAEPEQEAHTEDHIDEDILLAAELLEETAELAPEAEEEQSPEPVEPVEASEQRENQQEPETESDQEVREAPESEEEKAEIPAEPEEPEEDRAEAERREREEQKRLKRQEREKQNRQKREEREEQNQHKREEREEKNRIKREEREEKNRRKKQQREEKALQRKEERAKAHEPRPELTAEEAARQFASGVASLRRRMIPAFALCGVMVVLMLLGGSDRAPEVIRQGKTILILLAAIQLAVMLLGLDVLAKGVTDLLTAKPGCETLVLMATIAAEVDAVLMISGRGLELGTPYNVTATVSLAFAIWGSYCRRGAFRETIRAMRLASIPTVVSVEDKLAEEGSILNKKLGTPKGFLNRCTEPDFSERFYHKVTPLCLLLLVILAVAAAYLSGTGALVHCLAALSSAAAALTASLVFARPFFLIARKLSLNGAALAGWKGAEDMAKSVGLVIRDLDIYPENSVILNGMKVLAGAHVEKVVAFTGSVILATGSGLRRVFGELMRQYAAPLYRVEDFDCGTEGGVCAFIGQEQVLVGTSAYMNLMGIRVPGSVDVAGAVYTAIDHELCGVFIVNYLPQEPVQNALYRLETGRLRPIFAIRDFNISPSMLIQKFRLNEGSIAFLPPENRYQLSVEPEEDGQPAALLSREGLWHYSETARGGRRLWRVTRRALLMTVLGAILGVAIVFISCARGAFSSVTPLKLLAAMLLWAFATLMIAESAEGD